ncbi:MAG: RICIN domain-containing protein [Candidatus Saccharimonadales bacterium]
MKQHIQTRLHKGYRVFARVFQASLAVVFGALSLAVLQPSAATSAATTNGRIYTGYSSIYSRNPNGSDVKQLAGYPYGISQYSFSPDGKKIAYIVSQSTTSARLVVSNADMTGAVTIKSNITQALNQNGPSWSPDGQWLAYGTFVITSTQGNSTWKGYINLVKPDGTGGRVLPGVADRTSNLSWINSASVLYQNQNNTCVVSITTSAKTCNSVPVVGASFVTLLASPNGTQMAWVKLKAPLSSSDTDLYVSNLNGTNARRLTTLATGQTVEGFAWSPDGTSIAALIVTRVNGQTTNLAIRIVQKDTGNSTTIASGTASTATYGQLIANIAWQPIVASTPTPTPTPTPAPIPVPGSKLIQSQYSNSCLDVDTHGGGVNGNKVHMWSCSGGLNQKWIFGYDGTIHSVYSGRCLDVDTNGGGVDGNKVHMWSCSGGLNQKWTRSSDGTIRSQYSNSCLDVDTHGGGVNGNKVHMWSCSGGANQRWNIL